MTRVDWKRVRHAYGPATDVPRLLDDLAGNSDATVHAALES